MARELRALMYDNDAGEITRPDIPAALGSGPGDVDVRASGFHPRQERELAPYTAMPVLPSRLNEPTVPDAALKLSMAQAEVRDDHTPSDVGQKPRSGPRHEVPSPLPAAVASTLPPPRRTRSRKSVPPHGARARNSVPPESSRARKSLPPDSDNFAARARITAKATPAALREPEPPSLLRASLLVVGTAVVAAAIGVGLGNGSIERLFSSSPPADAREPALPVAHAAREKPALAPTPAAPVVSRPITTNEAPQVPVLRIDQLPPGEASADAAPKASATPTHRARR